MYGKIFLFFVKPQIIKKTCLKHEHFQERYKVTTMARGNGNIYDIALQFFKYKDLYC